MNAPPWKSKKLKKIEDTGKNSAGQIAYVDRETFLSLLIFFSGAKGEPLEELSRSSSTLGAEGRKLSHVLNMKQNEGWKDTDHQQN